MGVCPAARMKPWRLCWRVVSPIILMSAVEAMGIMEKDIPAEATDLMEKDTPAEAMYIMEKDIPAEGRVPKGKTYWDNHKHGGEGSSAVP